MTEGEDPNNDVEYNPKLLSCRYCFEKASNRQQMVAEHNVITGATEDWNTNAAKFCIAH